MESTHRLSLPMILPGQAQKEIAHNEGLQLLDVLVGGAVEEAPVGAQPQSPAVGSCYIIAVGATGEWAGRDGQIAAFTPGGWRFIAPAEGMVLHVRSSGEQATYRNGGWELGVLRASKLVVGGKQVIGAQSPAIAGPAGGTQVDAEARAAVNAVLAALRQHGLIAT